MLLTTKTLLLGLKKLFGKVRKVGLRTTLLLTMNKLSTIVDNKDFSVDESKCEEVIQLGLSDTYKIIIEGLKHKTSTKIISSNNSYKLKLRNKNLSFTWLVPFFSKGSGGHKNLFRFIKFLESFGCKCTVYIVKECEIELSPQEIKQKICEYFENISADVKIYTPGEKYEQANILVCTSWITAYAARTFDANLKVYFVQDYEPLFYSSGSHWYLAENTYSFGYYHISLGAWLTHLLREKYGVKADFYNVSVDNNLYYPRNNIKNEHIQSICNNQNFKICFYGRHVTPRRCFELVVMALYLFAQKVSDVTIIVYGWNEVPPLPFKCCNLGTLPSEDLAELYSACDVCIAPSATNISLVACEVMACGCVLMDLDVENTSYDLIHLSNSYLVKPDPESIFNGLMDLYSDRELLEKLKKSSVEHVSQLSSWKSQADTFYSLIKEQLHIIKENKL